MGSPFATNRTDAMHSRELHNLRARLDRLQGTSPSPLQKRLQDWENRRRRTQVHQLPLALGGQWLRRGVLLYLRHEEPLHPEPMTSLVALLTQTFPSRFDPEDLVFLDLETTGNGGAGVIPFLIGMGTWHGDTFVTEQFLLVDPGKETLLLKWVTHRLTSYRILVTYNGRSFDLPLLQDRLQLHRLSPLSFEGHMDLLHMVRRVLDSPWGYRLTDIERQFLGWVRDADLPSRWVPRAYFQFLHGQGTGLLRLSILHHRQDVRVLPRLLLKLDRWVQSPSSQHSSRDLYKIARLYLRLPDVNRARMFLEAGLRRTHGVDRHRFLKLKAVLHKRQKEWDLASECWHRVLRERPEDLESLEELSKYYEHRIKDPHRALLYAWQLPQDREETRRRVERLSRKIKKSLFRVFPV